MKSLHSLLFFFACTACVLPLTRVLGAESAAAYGIADATSGQLLDSAGADKKLQIGSLTKIATAMVVLDWAETGKQDIGAFATVPPAAVNVLGANPVGFQPGDQVSLRDLLYSALLQSDNVAAYTLADHVGRSLLSRSQAGAPPVDLFVAQMNALARKLGMTKTRFLNPHGLDNTETPYSTVHDMALLTSYAMKSSAFRFYVSQPSRRVARRLPTGALSEYKLINTNALLGVNAIDGVKTGKTAKAGECLIISAARPPKSILNPDGSHTITPRRLIVIVLNAADRFGLAERLLSRGWAIYDQQNGEVQTATASPADQTGLTGPTGPQG